MKQLLKLSVCQKKKKRKREGGYGIGRLFNEVSDKIFE